MPTKRHSSLRLSYAELLVSISILAVALLAFTPAFALQPDASQRRTCQNNLYQLGLVMRMYADESRGQRLPPMHGWENFLNNAALGGCLADGDGMATGPFSVQPEGPQDFDYAMDMRHIYPDYLAIPNNVLRCPLDPRPSPLRVLSDDGSGQCRYVGQVTNPDIGYMYLGYMIARTDGPSPSQVLASAEWKDEPVPVELLEFVNFLRPITRSAPSSYQQWADLCRELDTDILVADQRLDPETTMFNGVFRLRKGVERVLLIDINDPAERARVLSRIPICWGMAAMRASRTSVDRTSLPGINILFFDGHIEYVTPDQGDRVFPVSETFARAIHSLEPNFW